MIGDRIKERRLALKLSQAELGNMIGIGKSTISEWENNKRRPSIEMLYKIAEALETTAGYLLDRSREPIPTDEIALQINPDFKPGEVYLDGTTNATAQKEKQPVDPYKKQFAKVLTQLTDEQKEALLVLMRQMLNE